MIRMSRYDFLRHRKRLFGSQGKAAQALGVAQSCISQWESGARPLPEMAKILVATIMENLEFIEAEIQAIEKQYSISRIDFEGMTPVNHLVKAAEYEEQASKSSCALYDRLHRNAEFHRRMATIKEKLP